MLLPYLQQLMLLAFLSAHFVFDMRSVCAAGHLCAGEVPLNSMPVSCDRVTAGLAELPALPPQIRNIYIF